MSGTIRVWLRDTKARCGSTYATKQNIHWLQLCFTHREGRPTHLLHSIWPCQSEQLGFAYTSSGDLVEQLEFRLARQCRRCVRLIASSLPLWRAHAHPILPTI